MVTLSTAPGTGVISFKSEPPGATVFIDTMEYSATPVTINNIPIGSHAFILKLDGYTDFEDNAEVIEQRVCCIDTDLQQITSGVVCNTNPIQIKEVVPGAPGAPSTPSTPSTKSELSIGEYIVVGIVIGVILVLGIQYIQNDNRNNIIKRD
jgi:hypothetical protein